MMDVGCVFRNMGCQKECYKFQLENVMIKHTQCCFGFSQLRRRIDKPMADKRNCKCPRKEFEHHLEMVRDICPLLPVDGSIRDT